MPKRKNDEKTAGNQKYAKKQKEPVSIEDDAGDSKAVSSLSPSSTPGQSPKPSTVTAPISAIAARRALALVANNENDQQQDTDNDIDQQMEKSQMTDWDSEGDDNDQYERESETEVDNVNTTSSRNGSVIKRAKVEKVKPVQYDPKAISKFTPSTVNVAKITSKSNEEILVIGLRKDENIVFQGQALFAPLLGSFSALGALFGSDEQVPANLRDFECPEVLNFCPMFSPKTHSLICIEPAASRTSQLHQNKALPQKLSFPVRKQLQSALVAFQNSPGKFSTIVAVKSLAKSGIVDIEQILPLFKGVFNTEDAKSKSDDTAAQVMNSIPGFCPVLEPTPNVKSMQIPPSWSSGVNQFISSCNSSEDAQVALICGSKRMGKSTFSKYVVNRLLEKHERVAFLEADIGQPEFGVQGVVSLHLLERPLLSPPFANSHLDARRRFFIGSTSPRDDPDYYMACLTELLLVWGNEFGGVQVHDDATMVQQQVPLIINTHGWIKGLGYDLLMDLIHTAKPNFIFAFQSTATQSRNLPPSFITSVLPSVSSENKIIPKIHYLTSLMDDLDADFTAQRYHPSDHRMLNLISYLHMNHMDKRIDGSGWWDFKARLVERVPWSLDWTVGLQGIWVFFEEVKYSQLLYALNGSVVALIGDMAKKPKEITESDDMAPPFCPPSLYPPPSPQATHCFGLGLIRSIDVINRKFLILTPLPFDTLKEVSGVVKGDLELPIWAMLDSRSGAGGGIAGVPWRKVPYVSFDANEGIGNSALRIRRNVMRKAQGSK